MPDSNLGPATESTPEQIVAKVVEALWPEGIDASTVEHVAFIAPAVVQRAVAQAVVEVLEGEAKPFVDAEHLHETLATWRALAEQQEVRG